MAKIIYTHTDEAPALATQSLLPILRAFAAPAGVEFELRDISLAGRILAQFPERLRPEQQVADELGALGELTGQADTNIIKLPNISASLPQLKAAIAELQEQGFDLPDYPDNAGTDADRDVRARYDRVKGSAVNPVLREGNSDRRAPASVKAFARKHPHSMGAWSADSVSHVSTMGDGDFRSTEKSVTVSTPGTVRIEHLGADGSSTVLKERTPVLEGEVLDASVMRRAALDAFLRGQVQEAKEQGVLFSVHLKATMMKVSDPIIFGHAVRAVVGDLYDTYPDARPADGLASLLSAHPEARSALDAALAAGPADRDGRLRPRHHQPARAQRRHHRRLDAGRDPHVRPDVERRGQAAGHEVRHPRLVLRRAVRRDRRALPTARRVRSGDDGHHAERRADGAAGRGVRLARQDLRDRGSRHGARRRRAGRGAARARGRRPATSGACARRRTRQSATGWSSR